MIHFLLLMICIFSVEIFNRLNFFLNLDSITKLTKKASYIILNENISDHWKEKTIPAYAFKIMKHSLQIILILSLVLSLFLIPSFFFNNFVNYIFSLIGILESMVFVFGYVWLRKLYTQ